jgi:hypothetical protein
LKRVCPVAAAGAKKAKYGQTRDKTIHENRPS